MRLVLSMAVAALVLANPVSAQSNFKEPLNMLGKQQKEFRALAVKGDYQGMRNLAYSYQAPFSGEAGSKIGACAWYVLIPVVHREKFHGGDVGNIHVSCGKLSPTDLEAAYEYAFRTLARAK